MIPRLDHNQRLDHAKTALEHMAERAVDADQKINLKEAAYALGVAEDRIGALEAVVRILANKAGLKRFDIGYPTGRQFPEQRLADLLG
jgi:hypothetical protein